MMNASSALHADGAGTLAWPRNAGMAVAASSATRAEDAIAEIARELSGSDIGFLVLFISSHYQPEDIVAALARHLPGVQHAGCSTAGEIGRDGPTDSSIVAMAFPRRDFAIVAAPLESMKDFGIEHGSQLVSELRRRLAPTVGGVAGDLFAVTMLDGLCQREELVLSALQGALDDIPLVGGSSGDDLAFRNTFVIADGKALRQAGILLLIRTTQPFRVFKSDHFEPTSKKLVVTACDPEMRIVTEFNAEPAKKVFAEATGLDPQHLDGTAFASHPLLVRVGGEYYCRSIQKMNADGSLSFYCAIDNGVVLTVAKPKNMTEALEATLCNLDEDLGGLDFVLGFDCIHRRLEAESRHEKQKIAEIYRRFRVFGFYTYGEQFNAMHLNHTFTGVALGHRQSPP
ncbi:MAG: FIST N-terminal domain-containing protein [Ancalomicrobiaceae bacterium]|nr:FIST N-terminal domain-containing protein [Ancalomicrobiaceae bacterium]